MKGCIDSLVQVMHLSTMTAHGLAFRHTFLFLILWTGFELVEYLSVTGEDC